jgi:hypothetical protein
MYKHWGNITQDKLPPWHNKKISDLSFRVEAGRAGWKGVQPLFADGGVARRRPGLQRLPTTRRSARFSFDAVPVFELVDTKQYKTRRALGGVQ